MNHIKFIADCKPNTGKHCKMQSSKFQPAGRFSHKSGVIMSDENKEKAIEYLLKEIENAVYTREQKQALNDAASILINTRSQEQVNKMEIERGLRAVK